MEQVVNERAIHQIVTADIQGEGEGQGSSGIYAGKIILASDNDE